MYTSEFIEQVEALPFVGEVIGPISMEGTVVIKPTNNRMLAFVRTDEMHSVDTQYFDFAKISDEEKSRLMSIIWQYISTPVDEREEEQRFRLMDKPELIKSLTNPYLNMNKETGRLMNGGSVDNVFYKTVFTDSELKDLFTEQQLHWIEMTFDKEWIDE